MSKYKYLIIGFLIIVFTYINIQGQSCDDPRPPDNSGSPGGDNADDNYSYSTNTTSDFYYFPTNSQIQILKNGSFYNVIKSLTVISKTPCLYYGKDQIYKVTDSNSMIIIPSGGLFGKENDIVLKNILREYVQNGGTIIVFAQQYGSHIENVIPVPLGEQLKCYGWRQDQSCTRNSSTAQEIHPVLSSLMTQRADVGVDGYF